MKVTIKPTNTYYRKWRVHLLKCEHGCRANICGTAKGIYELYPHYAGDSYDFEHAWRIAMRGRTAVEAGGDIYSVTVSAGGAVTCGGTLVDARRVARAIHDECCPGERAERDGA